MNTNPQKSPEVSQEDIDREIEELLKSPRKSRPNITPVEDPALPRPDKRRKTADEQRIDSDGFVLMPAKRKSPFKALLLAIVIIGAVIAAAVFGLKSVHIGQTECCDGTWSESKGSGTCSHHGGIIGVGCRQCNDGSWSTAKGSGACSRHGGLKKEEKK